MNAEIRIFPAHKLEAVDMAVLMDASLIRDGVVQGCELTIEQNELQIATGRLMIHGRMGVVTAGQIDRPTSISSTQTCYLCAVCDLSAEEPFTIGIYTATEYNALLDRAKLYTGDKFNANDGVAAFKMADVTVNPSKGVTAITQNENWSAKNVRGLDPYSNIVNKNRSLSDSRYGYLKHRVYAGSKFFHWAFEIPQRTIAAGARATFTSKNRYGVELAWKNNKIETTYKYANKTYKNITDSNGYRVDPAAFKTFDNYGPQFLEPIAIAGIIVRDATTGGKNSKNCSILAWRFTDTETSVDIVNNGKEAAVIRIHIRMLYAQTE